MHPIPMTDVLIKRDIWRYTGTKERECENKRQKMCN
jgi:hypothetical protein